MKTTHLKLSAKAAAFVDNTKLYFSKVFDLCKQGQTRQDAYDTVEAEYREVMGKSKYSSYESFVESWYQFYNKGIKRK